jgi:hypothetical protein
MTAKRKLSAKELDALHDSGRDMSAHLVGRSSRRPGLEIQRVNVDFPVWMIESLDKEADRLGVPRQSVIKFWISECLTGRGSKRDNPALGLGVVPTGRRPRPVGQNR